MITLPQIKAARALLNWTQEKLAQAADVSLPSINNFERGLYSPRPETFAAIVSALEKSGVEFTAQNGVQLRHDAHDIISFNGPDFLRDLDRDILSVLHGKDDEIAGCWQDERKWMEYGSVTNPLYIAARIQCGWRERFLIPDAASFITSPPESYRMLKADKIGQIAYEIYGTRLALIEWEAQRVTIVKNSAIVDMFLRQFNALWEIATPIPAKQLKKMERLKV